MSPSSVALLVPPGWTLLTGGPHLALPLLAGAIRRENIPVHVSDWNLEAAKHLGAGISEEGARLASVQEDIASMNAPYFHAQDAIKSALDGTTAAWELQLGYEDRQFDRVNPAQVREALKAEGPLDQVLTSLASDLLANHSPRLVGISITVPGQILPAFYAARALRTCGFSGPIVLGGNVVSRLGSKMALPWVFDLIDALVLWQGECVLPHLFRVSTNREWDAIPNLIWRDSRGIRVNPTKNLSPAEFGPPDFNGLPLANYWGSQFLTAVASRGCYYGRCSFCSIPYGWGNGGFLGNDTPEAVVRQFETAIKLHGVRRFKFVDEALHPGLMSRVADLLIERQLGIEFEGYARFDRSWFAPGLLQRLSKAGLKKLYLGLELVASQGRDLLNKADHADSGDLLAAIADQGILAHAFCMFGFPGTGVDEAISTIDFALKHDSMIDTLDVFPFYYATHTKVSGVETMSEIGREWALEQKYVPAAKGVLAMEEVSELAAELDGYLWRAKPRWLHPVYRMSSPWTPLQ